MSQRESRSIGVLPPIRLGPTARRVMLGNAVGAAIALTAGFLGAANTSGRDPVFFEAGPVEGLQLLLWIVALWAGGYALARAPSRRDAWNAAWLMVLAALAFLRECDLHEAIDADHWPGYGVSFMLNWWTDGSVSVVRKAVWALVFAGVGFGLAIPPLIVHAPAIKLFKRGDPGVWLIVVAFAWLALGYAADDLLGRGQFVREETSRAVEEAAELVGVAFFACSLIYTALEPLTRRIERLDAARTNVPAPSNARDSR